MTHFLARLSNGETHITEQPSSEDASDSAFDPDPLSSWHKKFENHVTTAGQHKNCKTEPRMQIEDVTDRPDGAGSEEKEQQIGDYVEALERGLTPALQFGSLYTTSAHAISLPLRFKLSECASNPSTLVAKIRSENNIETMGPEKYADTEIVLKIDGAKLADAMKFASLPSKKCHFVPFRIDMTRVDKYKLEAPLDIFLRTTKVDKLNGDDVSEYSSSKAKYRIWTDQKSIDNRKTTKDMVFGESIAAGDVHYSDPKGIAVFSAELDCVNDEAFHRWKAEDFDAIEKALQSSLDADSRYYSIHAGARDARTTYDPLLWFISQNINHPSTQEWWSQNSTGYENEPSFQINKDSGTLQVPVPLADYLLRKLETCCQQHDENAMNLADGVELVIRVANSGGWIAWAAQKGEEVEQGFPASVWNAPMTFSVDFVIHGVPICAVPANGRAVPDQYPWGPHSHQERMEYYGRSGKKKPFARITTGAK